MAPFKKSTVSLIVLSPLILGGCATIVNKTQQKIMVTTPPKATCLLSNKRGQWPVDKASPIVSVKRSPSPLIMSCTYPNKKQTITKVKPTLNKFWSAVVLAELIALPGGTAISVFEFGTGSVFEYPKTISENNNS
jgi:hypothetical protein